MVNEDLVTRLRLWAHECEEQNGPGMWSQDMRLAAKSIEDLHTIYYSQSSAIEHLETKVSALEDKTSSPEDEISRLQDKLAKIQYTNLRRDMNIKTRTRVIDEICKETK